jgi:glutathione S-transferase
MQDDQEHANMLTLFYHPLSSFCWKALIALYENDTPFEKRIVDLGDEADRAAFLKVWPLGKFPVLRDGARDCLVPESSTIIEYLAQHYPGRTQLAPADPDLARRTRMSDRFYDLYINTLIGKIVTDKLRPPGKNDAFGVAQARAQLDVALGMVEADTGAKRWAMGDTFTMADCAAAPALFYADKVSPFGDARPNTLAYLRRLRERPSFARVLEEAAPYFAMFPG